VAALPCFAAILQGNFNFPTPSIKNAAASFPKFIPLWNSFKDIRKRAEEKCSSLVWFNVAAEDLFAAFLDEYHMRVGNKMQNIKEYINLRMRLGSDPFFELGLALRHIVLPDVVREHPLFAEIKRRAWKAIFLTNDICSFAKDMQQKDGPVANYLKYKQVMQGLSTQEAYQHAVGSYNRLTAKMLIAEEDLKQKFSTPSSSLLDDSLRRGLDLINDMVQGHVSWCFEATRYKSSKDVVVKYNEKRVLTEQELSWLFGGFSSYWVSTSAAASSSSSSSSSSSASPSPVFGSKL